MNSATSSQPNLRLYGIGAKVTAPHARGLQFKPSPGHWNLSCIKIYRTTPLHFGTCLEVEKGQEEHSLTKAGLPRY